MVEFLRLSRSRAPASSLQTTSRGSTVSGEPVAGPRRTRLHPSRGSRSPVFPLFPHRVLSIVSQRVYYVREDIMKRATSVSRDQLVSLGVCVGKFTHSDKFRLTIGALELLAAHAKHKVRRRRRAIEETITTLGPRAARPTPLFRAISAAAR